ncbi:MAG: iron-sulfur cluster assembly accessory protein [Chlamydiales bacterium]|nr:iron-sulfur cluster assembly accessory protein [Chlamydiia bacterium]MCP5507193.1 iron-sulfur cluster assembly accessory protein [Chlamydiales bacterium]
MTSTESDKVIKPQPIHREMTIEEILSSHPHRAQRLAQVLTNAGLHCVGCQAATWETLEAGAKGHGLTDEHVDALVNMLNAILEEEVDMTTISMTKRAAQKLIEILEEEGKQGWALRFGDKMAGCSGFEYLLDFSEKAQEDDEVFVSHGIEIHVKKASVERLLGSEIDYVEGLQSTGFKISNPNARSSCGCGSSHGY